MATFTLTVDDEALASVELWAAQQLDWDEEKRQHHQLKK